MDAVCMDFKAVFAEKSIQNWNGRNCEQTVIQFESGWFSTESFKIVSTWMKLRGNMTRLSGMEASQKSSHPHLNTNAVDEHTVISNPSLWLLDVQNSTLWMTSWCLDVEKPGWSACLLSSSDLTIEGSEIISNMDCSPFLVRGDLDGHGSHIQIIRSTHISKSNMVLPLVGTCRNAPGIDIANHMMKGEAPDGDLRDLVSISGVGLSMKNQHFALGTGPLFTFHTVAVLDSGMSVETSLLGSTLVNVSSSNGYTSDNQVFGSEVRQLVVGSCVMKSTNHDSGTGMMSPNLGGSLTCLNTSFSSCIRQRNTDLEFSFENHTQGGRLDNVTSDVTSVSFTLCTFKDMTDTVGSDKAGAAIFLDETSSSLTVRTCFFHKCTVTMNANHGGAIYFRCDPAEKRPITVSGSSFTECSAIATDDYHIDGGCLYIYYASSSSIEKSFFEQSTADFWSAVCVHSDVVSIAHSSFVECFGKEGGGAMSILGVTTLSLSFSQFRGCSAESPTSASDLYFGYTIDPSLITSDMIRFCDSTSDHPNIYFEWKYGSTNSHLIPLISPTHTIMSVDVSCNGDEATVTVETDIAIEGTMAVLLKGSNVPRLVHVVFGKPLKPSKIGTMVVSSGSNGILPYATYEHHKSTLAPFPQPKITKMEFSFSNGVHTGCLVKLTGTDLIVGISLNVTLNNTLNFIATVTSETEAKSAEIQIGWPTTLQHNQKYQITAIKAVNEADGTALFASAVSDTTGSLPDDLVIFVDSGSSSDSSFFCGDRTRPCSTIEDGWKIAKDIEISTFKISILHNTTQKEQVTLQSQHEVVIESIPSTSPELIVSPSLSSSELDGEGMIDVSGGRLLILQVDIVLANSPSLIFVRMVGGDLTIKTCSFVGPKGNAASNNVDSSSFLCDWETGFLKLMDATTTITVTQMSHLSQGAINMKNGKLTMETCTFHDNSPPSISFSSLRHNIRCSEEGEIEIESLSAGDGMETPSAWISATDCSLAAKEEISRSPFFVPTLSSSSTSKLSKDKTGFDVTIEGTTLIPCSLFLEVFEKKKDGTEGQQKQVPLTQELASHFNDTSIVVSLPLSSLSSFDDSLEWRGRLAFGNDQITASSFVIQLSAAGRRSQAVLENMKWWLPLVIVLSLLLVIVVVVVIICWRRRRIQKNPTTMEEMKESTQLQMEDEKMDIVTDNRIGVLSIQTCAPSESNADTTQLNAPKSSDGLHDFENVEEALPCCGDMKNTVYVSKDRTLYNALHSENKWDVRIRQAQLQLVKGLKEVEKKDRTAAILRALTAHNILFDSKENVCLKMNPDVTTHTHRPTWTQQTPPDQHTQQEQPEQGSTMGTNESKQIVAPQTERVNEGVRWLAPEVIENKPHINSGHGAVFSLGLILWEMETGSVPFGEQDAVNASRQIVTGVVPKLELVENAEMRELISQCLSLEPDDRPDFDTIESTLSLIPAGQSINPKEFVQS